MESHQHALTGSPICRKLVELNGADSAPLMMGTLKRPVAFQPTLADGNVYLGTTDGMVICLKTGQADVDGWYAWGGNAKHNTRE